MKKFLLLLAILLTSPFTWGQTDVTLKINHKLNLADFTLDAAAVNNLGQSYKTSRLEYYISKFIIYHDGGMETTVPLDVIALVQPGEELITLIPLGNYAITTVEQIQFSIGVYEPINNGDPTLFDETHPLGPKSPAMHWGWAAGYRFVAYEGFGGIDYAQNFQLHGLGNDNYFRQWQEVRSELLDGVIMLNLDANYTEALRDINVSAGVVSHGETGSALKMLENFRDHVFGNYFATIADQAIDLNWSIYPNPTVNGEITLKIETTENVVYTLQISNAVGQIIETVLIKNNESNSLLLPTAGVYSISIFQNEQLIGRTKAVRL